MGWVYLDDHWDDPGGKLAKIYEDAPSPFGLWVVSLTHCRRAGSETGVLSRPQTRALLGWNAGRQKKLLDASAWDEMPDGGIAVHNYEEWNRTSRSASARNAAQIRWAREQQKGDAE